MSFINDLAPSDQRLLEYDAATNPAPKHTTPTFWQNVTDPIGPGAYQGLLEGAVGLEAGFSNAWEGALDAAAGAFLPKPRELGEPAGRGGLLRVADQINPFATVEDNGRPDVTSLERMTQEDLGQGLASKVQELHVDPATTGMAGQVLGSLAIVLPRTAVGAVVAGPVGGAISAGAPAGYSRTVALESQGVDESTASKVGAVEGAVTGIGAFLPMARIVKPVVGDAALSVGANVGLGIVQRGVSAEILESRGYTAQAAQFKAFDKTSMLIDAVLGGFFFGIGRMTGASRPTTSEVDAALTERLSQHADADTAPGLPVDPRSSVAHQYALRSAIEQINRGETVVLPDNIHAAEFIRTIDDVVPIIPPRADIEASARADVLPTVRQELEQELAGIVPNVRDLRTEMAGLQRSIDGLDSTFRDRAKEFQQQDNSRKQSETLAREAIDQERVQTQQRLDAIEEQLVGNRTAEQARADLAAIDRGEVSARLEERVKTRAAEIERGFQRNPLADGVSGANRFRTQRQVDEAAARSEIDRAVTDYESTLPPVRKAPSPRTEVTPEPAPARPAEPAGKRQSEGPTIEQEGQQAPRAGGGEELQLLRNAVARLPDAMVRVGEDADGNPIMVRADEALVEIEAEHAAGMREAEAYNAAITCMLRL